MAYLLNQEQYQNAFQKPLAIGEIELTREQLWLHDPFLLPYEEALPFLHPVPRGRFPVELAIQTLPNGDQRVAYARIVFRPVKALYFELGLTAETLGEELGAEEFCGTPSETGYLCFADVKMGAQLPQNPQEAQRFERQWQQDLERQQRQTFSYSAKPQAVAFTAGWGEGLYPLFFGYEREPRDNEALYPVCAVVDLLLD